MQIEKQQLGRDVTHHQQEIAEYEQRIAELEDEFNVEYAPEDGDKLDFDDGYTKQNMMKEKTKLMEDQDEDDELQIEESDMNFGGDDDESDDQSDDSSEEKNRKQEKKDLMNMLGKEGMIDQEDAEKEITEDDDSDEDEEFTETQ